MWIKSLKRIIIQIKFIWPALLCGDVLYFFYVILNANVAKFITMQNYVGNWYLPCN